MRNLSPEQQALVRSTYDNIRLYHGTSTAGKASIRQNGFDLSRKDGGATAKVGIDDEEFIASAGSHNYLTRSNEIARSYAVTGSDTPALVRVIVNPSAVGLEEDEDSPAEHQALRTPRNIPPGTVLQSKTHGDTSRSGAANQEFQQQLAAGKLHVSEAQAAELLAGVQSDSDEDDFDDAPRMTVTEE